MIEEERLAPIHSSDAGHLIIGEFKSKMSMFSLIRSARMDFWTTTTEPTASAAAERSTRQGQAGRAP